MINRKAWRFVTCHWPGIDFILVQGWMDFHDDDSMKIDYYLIKFGLLMFIKLPKEGECVVNTWYADSAHAGGLAVGYVEPTRKWKDIRSSFVKKQLKYSDYIRLLKNFKILYFGIKCRTNNIGLSMQITTIIQWPGKKKLNDICCFTMTGRWPVKLTAIKHQHN